MRRFLYILFLLPLFTQCTTSKLPVTMTSYTYFDGNNNTYTITETSIVYNPVKPEQSSTGLYSGGEPYTAPLEPNQFKELEAVILRSVSNPEGQFNSRTKGTGMVVVSPGKKSYIFSATSIQKNEIETALLLYTRR